MLSFFITATPNPNPNPNPDMIGKAKSGTGADEFLPLMIYTLLNAQPQSLHATVDFVTLCREPQRMLHEQGYYFTHLVSAVRFLSQLQCKDLVGVSPAEFQAWMDDFDPEWHEDGQLEAKDLKIGQVTGFVQDYRRLKAQNLRLKYLLRACGYSLDL
jgi:hypothetical protein